MKIGDKVRVIFRNTESSSQWYGDEGVIVEQYSTTGNFQIRITKRVNKDLSSWLWQNWGEEDLELLFEGDFESLTGDGAYGTRVKLWKEFYGI